jgi:hypothetical protein
MKTTADKVIEIYAGRAILSTLDKPTVEEMLTELTHFVEAETEKTIHYRNQQEVFVRQFRTPQECEVWANALAGTHRLVSIKIVQTGDGIVTDTQYFISALAVKKLK